DAMKKFADLSADGEIDQALAYYRGLPEAQRRDKALLLLRLQVTQAYSDDDYAQCIDDFRRFHPEDRVLDCVLIDGHILRGEHEEALRSIDRTNDHVGGDPLLLVQRAAVL